MNIASIVERQLPRAIKAEGGGSKPAQFLSYWALMEAQAIDARRVLHIAAGRGTVLRYLAESREGRYSGLSTVQHYVAQASEEAYTASMQNVLRMYRGDLNDPRTYKAFPEMDMVLAFDLPVSLLAVLPLAAEALRGGGRFLVSGFFQPSQEQKLSEQGFYVEGEVLEAAEAVGLKLVEKKNHSAGVRIAVGAGIAAVFANLEKSLPAREVLEAWGLRKQKLEYLLLSFAKE